MIDITDKYAIKADSSQWIVVIKADKINKKTGKNREAVFFYSQLVYAMQDIMNRMLRDKVSAGEITTLAELMKSVKEAQGTITKLCDLSQLGGVQGVSKPSPDPEDQEDKNEAPEERT